MPFLLRCVSPTAFFFFFFFERRYESDLVNERQGQASQEGCLFFFFLNGRTARPYMPPWRSLLYICMCHVQEATRTGRSSSLLAPYTSGCIYYRRIFFLFKACAPGTVICRRFGPATRKLIRLPAELAGLRSVSKGVHIYIAAKDAFHEDASGSAKITMDVE